jgi:hypothetical protein
LDGASDEDDRLELRQQLEAAVLAQRKGPRMIRCRFTQDISGIIRAFEGQMLDLDEDVAKRLINEHPGCYQVVGHPLAEIPEISDEAPIKKPTKKGT